MKFFVATFGLASAVQLSAALQSTAPQQPPPPPTFRSSVDLVPVDVNVLDKTGRPMPDLTAADFSLKVDGKPRRIATAQFIAVRRDTVPAPADDAGYSSNPPTAGGRLIMLVIDQGNIGISRGKYAIESARKFIGRLSPADRIGLTTIPGAGPQIDFTSNHALVQMALQKIAGQWDEGEHQDNQIGLSEAIELQRGNDQLLQRILDRECTGLLAGDDLATCRTKVLTQARRLYIDLKTRTRDSLLSLHHVMDRLARTTTPKTVVLMSEGILIERESTEIAWLGPLAARGQVALYVLQLEPPIFEATGVRNSPTRGDDIKVGQDGLDRVAGMARGSVFRVISGADQSFTRLATELSGYYLLSFEPEPGDRDAKSHKIKIEVPARKDLIVRARNDFTVEAPRVASTVEQLAEAIAAPLLATDIGLKLNTYSFTGKDSGRIRVILAAEIDRSQNATGKLALAYTVVDGNNQIVSTQVEPDVSAPVRPDTQTQTYLGAVTLAPGTYILKLAVVNDAGKRGSVEHTIHAKLTPAGQIHVTDLLLGDESAGGLTPSVSAEFSGGLLHGYLELESEAVEVLRAAAVTFELAPKAGARAVDSTPVRFNDDPAAPATRRTAEAALPIALLPPGEYVARAVVTVAGRPAGQVSRSFRIVKSAAATPESAAAAGGLPVKAPVPFTSRIEAFERSAVLAPPVVGFFLDRMSAGSRSGPAAAAVLDAARTGKFDDAVETLRKAGNDQRTILFLEGLSRYAQGDLEAAAGRFRESLRLDAEFFPAIFYLGASYAAGGRDREAAGAWQTSLITEGDAPFIYTLLADAFLRLKDTDAALDILKEASSLWPGNPEVQLRLGTAYAQASRPVEAVRALDPYLAQHPQDQERLFVAMRAIYEARAAGQTIGTAQGDREQFERYAKAYAEAAGPQQALVEQWRKFLVR